MSENITVEDKRINKAKINAAKYPHAKLETMTYHEEVNKCACFIKCTVCGNEDTEVYTSDLFQRKMCDACAAEAKKAKKAALQAQKAEAPTQAQAA